MADEGDPQQDDEAVTAEGDQAPPSTGASASTLAEDEPELGYRVDLDAFSGPLDLLLYLVRRNEVDITDIPISTIAEQFVEAISSWEDMDLEIAGDFILMAATLLEIKARMIRPPVETEEEDDEEEEEFVDPRADLIQQLLAYRDTKEAGKVLEALELERWRCHRRRFQETIPEDPDEAEGVDLNNADPFALFSAWEKVLESIAGNGPRTVVFNDIPIDQRVKQLEAAMRASGEARLDWLLQQEERPIQKVGLFIATLEGIRVFMEAVQHEQYGPVYLRFKDEEERGREAAPLPPLEEDEPGKKKRRRRRPPLVTWHPPEGEQAQEQETEEAPEEEEEIHVESDEERFLRELNEASSVDSILTRVGDLDNHMNAYLVEQGVIEPPPVVGETAGTDEASNALAQGDEATIAALKASNASISEPQTPETTSSQAAEAEEDEDEFDDDEDEFDDDDEDEFDEDDDDDDD